MGKGTRSKRQRKHRELHSLKHKRQERPEATDAELDS